MIDCCLCHVLADLSDGFVPIGWLRVSILSALRVPCDDPRKAEFLSLSSRAHYYCPQCHHGSVATVRTEPMAPGVGYHPVDCEKCGARAAESSHISKVWDICPDCLRPNRKYTAPGSLTVSVRTADSEEKT